MNKIITIFFFLLLLSCVEERSEPTLTATEKPNTLEVLSMSFHVGKDNTVIFIPVTSDTHWVVSVNNSPTVGFQELEVSPLEGRMNGTVAVEFERADPHNWMCQTAIINFHYYSLGYVCSKSVRITRCGSSQ